MIGRRTNRGQNAQGLILAAAASGGQDLTQLVDGGLKQHGRQPGVLGDMPALTDGSAGSMVDELQGRDREDIAGDHPGGDGPGDRRGVPMFEPYVYPVGLGAGCRGDALHGTDEHTPVLHIGARR
ncbi:Uncharacterised protein [Mycobacteroides abscessus subsp. massiliense]|nr:Uncharacterised protein [Mycobacteroides abscessus subsp. massiliense]